MNTSHMSARGTGLPRADGAGAPLGMAGHIVLVGLPGAGKSSVAPRLAEALGCPVHDIDAEIVRRAGRPVQALFAERGEASFRDMEAVVTRELLSGPPSVIAAGGGWVLTEANWEAAESSALVVHLRVTPATALGRIGADPSGRPLLDGPEPERRLAELDAARRERYARADVVVDTELLDMEEVVRSVLLLINRSV